MHLLMLPNTNTTWAILGSLLVCALGITANWWHREKPARDRAEEGWDAILGTAEVKDLGGGIIKHGQTGLVDRVSHLEKQGSELAQAILTLADQQDQLRALASRQSVTEGNVEDLTATMSAIIADKWENGAKDALKAVEKKNADVIDEETP